MDRLPRYIRNQVNQHAGWFVKLQNEEWIFQIDENNSDGKWKGELSSWQQLLQRCELGNERIVELYLRRGGIIVRALPHRRKKDDLAQHGAQGFFQAYEMHSAINGKGSLLMQGIGAIFGDMIIITWMDAYGNTAQDVRPLSKMWVHTNMRNLNEMKGI